MLRNTLILPESDAQLASDLLRDAIDDLDVVLMLIIGRTETAEQAVKWADRLCNKTRIDENLNVRHVIWIRKPDTQPIRKVLDPVLGENVTPLVAVLNFHDQVKKTLTENDEIRPITLELAFLEGHKQ